MRHYTSAGTSRLKSILNTRSPQRSPITERSKTTRSLKRSRSSRCSSERLTACRSWLRKAYKAHERQMSSGCAVSQRPVRHLKKTSQATPMHTNPMNGGRGASFALALATVVVCNVYLMGGASGLGAGNGLKVRRIVALSKAARSAPRRQWDQLKKGLWKAMSEFLTDFS